MNELLNNLVDDLEELAVKNDYANLWGDPSFPAFVDLIDSTRCSLWIDGDLEAARQQVGELLYRLGMHMVRSMRMDDVARKVATDFVRAEKW